MGKSDLLKDGMKSGLDGLLSSTKKSPQKKETAPAKAEKEPAVNWALSFDILRISRKDAISSVLSKNLIS